MNKKLEQKCSTKINTTLLPQEINNKLFEVMPEPIGVDTVGTSRRDVSHNWRTPSCPKMVVSPWVKSTIEPDTNKRPSL